MTKLPKVPKELELTDQWILWKLVTRDGKATKVPCDAVGKPIPVNDPRSWLSYADAWAAHEASPHTAGIGFCFTADDDFIGIDLDDCIPLAAHGAEIAGFLAGTYGEISPSGTGIKFIGRGKLPAGYRNRTKDVEGFGQIEVYDSDRFFTITGNVFGFSFELGDIQDAVTTIADRWLSKVEPERQQRPTVQGSSLLERAAGFEQGDDELINLLREDPKYDALWTGDTADYGDDHSAADLALLEKIAWLAGPVPDRIEAIFSQSALADRAKWDRPDYRERSIEKALEGKTDFYQGGFTPALAAEDFAAPDHSGQSLMEIANEHARREAEGPTFPIPEAGIIRDVVDLVGPLTESPDSTLALGTLVMLSAVAGWGRVSKWGESEEPCILYASIVGPSASGRKTTGLRTVEAVFREVFTDDELRLESGGHVSGRGLIETAIGGVEVFYKKAKEPVGVPQTIEDPEGGTMPHPDWAEYDDLVAKQQDKLDNPPHVVLLWDEMAKLLSVEGDWQRDTRAELLSMYNGHHRGIRTSGKEGLKVPKGKVQMAFLGTMVTDDLRRGLNSAQANDGLMGRILFSPDSREDKPFLAFPPEPDSDYEVRKLAVARKLIRFRERCATRQSVFADWTQDARLARESWYAERKRGQGLELMLFDRIQATAAKIACLLALAEDSDVVGVRHVELAQGMADTSIRVSVDAVEAAVEAQRDRYLDALVERLTQYGPMPISKLWENGLLGVKEPGERMPEREQRMHWISKDPRIEVEPSPRGGGHRLRLKGEDDGE